MYGRYGGDQLSMALLVLSVVLNFIPNIVARILAIVIVVLVFFRMFSKKPDKRRKENAVFLKFWTPLYTKVKRVFTKGARRAKQSKQYKFFKCPNCKQELRVPKGKGKIKITCPSCKQTFEGKA